MWGGVGYGIGWRHGGPSTLATHTSWSQFGGEGKIDRWRYALEKHEGFKDAYRYCVGYHLTTGRSVPVSPSMTAGTSAKPFISLFRTGPFSG